MAGMAGMAGMAAGSAGEDEEDEEKQTGGQVTRCLHRQPWEASERAIGHCRCEWRPAV